VYGFPRSTFVNIVRLVLMHKDVPYVFHDLESVMGKSEHLALHPFNRVPILKHGDFTVYETSAIVSYIDEAFEGSRLTPPVGTRAEVAKRRYRPHRASVPNLQHFSRCAPD
jgi:glutathione S-transferase